MLFDSSVRKEIARSFGATLVVILTIVLTMMLIRTLGLAANGVVAPKDVVLLLGYMALGQLPTMLALSMFIAIVVSLGRMYRDSEMAIWFTSGLGLSRFVRPVLQTGWPVLLVVALLVVFAWPWVNRKTAEMRTRYEQRSDLMRVAPGSFQTSGDGNRVFFIEREGDVGGVGRNVFLVDRRGDRESVTTANEGHLQTEGQERFLVLDSGHRNEMDAEAGTYNRASFDQYRMRVDLDRAASAQASSPKTLPTLELLRSAQPTHRGELSWRLSLALAACNMLLLGVGTAATNPRRASNWNLLFALLAFIVYYNLVNLTQAWIAADRVGLGTALLALHGSAFSLALGLIAWRDHANVWRWPTRWASGLSTS